MKLSIKHIAFTTVVLSVSQALPSLAGTEPYFEPLTESAAVVSPNAYEEFESPWVVPAGIRQKNLTSLSEVEADVRQSIQRVPGLGSSASMFDMSAFGPFGRYLFIPHETLVGAAVTRYDIYTDRAEVIFAGDASGDFTNDTDFGAFDPARVTPNGTVIAAEEWSGQGRVVEIMNPYGRVPSNPVAGSGSMRKCEGESRTWWHRCKGYRVLPIPRVSHEGINFSRVDKNKVIYFIDEDNSGSIYKFVMRRRGDYTRGQTFVLVDDDFAATGGDPTKTWSTAPNNDPIISASRFGEGTWVAITDKNGEPIEGVTNPYDASHLRAGRNAADDVGATPWGRPEDMSINISNGGNDMLIIATTSEAQVISIEDFGNGKAMVRQLAKEGVTPKNVGFAPTTGVLNSPDNIALDALGNIYIIEDAPNSSSTGGDIWFARDTDNDGVAESLDHFMSIRVDGSEATGMIFNPAKTTEFVVSVQHPDSTDLDNVPEGFGDAVWKFDLRRIKDRKFVRALKRADVDRINP